MRRGVTQHTSMQSWLRSKAPGSGGGGAGGRMLSGWKKDGKGIVDTWLHTQCLPLTVWRHSFPTTVLIEDRKTNQKVAHIWGRNYTCHETENVLEEMYFREVKGDPSSARKTPPERCGICKFNEFMWQSCWTWLATHRWAEEEDGDGPRKGGRWVLTPKGKKLKSSGKEGPVHFGIDPCAVLFEFRSEASDRENVTIHVGGICGLFNRDDLPEDLRKAMAAARISPKEAWKETAMVKPKSVMCVVDNDKPEKGVQISEETKDLGEKVKEKIIEVLDGSEINIQKRPYCIRWEFDRSRPMGKQYSVKQVMKLKPTPRILEAIRGPAPDISAITTPFNQQSMRALFERHCKVDRIPWDELFPSKKQEEEWAKQDAEEEEEAAAIGVDEDDADDDADADDDGEVVACDACGKPHAISATECPHCGHKYDVEDEPAGDDADESEEEPVPAPRRGATVTNIRFTAPADGGDDDGQDDDIPF